MFLLPCWYLLGSLLDQKFWLVQNLIFLGSFRSLRERCLLSNLYEQHVAVSVCEDILVLEQCLQLSRNVFSNLTKLLLSHLVKHRIKGISNANYLSTLQLEVRTKNRVCFYQISITKKIFGLELFMVALISKA